MSVIVDARGLLCPHPVIKAKKAIEKNDDVVVIVDNTTALENVKRMGKSKGCKISVETADDNSYMIHLLSRRGKMEAGNTDEYAICDSEDYTSITGPSVILISGDKMGRGDDELGEVLMKAFINTILDLDKLPDIMIFYNTGVKLTVKNSDVIDDLRKLEEMGIEILICGTCTNYFNISDDIGVGAISNMYDIASTISRSGRIITP